MAARAAKRDWSALEGKLVPPEGWNGWNTNERRVYILLRGISDPLSALEIANELDLTLGEVQEMIDDREMRTAQEARRVPIPRMLKLIETSMERILLAVDARRLAGADLGKLTAGLRDLVNARALLLGEPTQIVGSAQRAQLNDLATMLLHEARRRGISVQADPATGQIVTRRPVTIDTTGRPS